MEAVGLSWGTIASGLAVVLVANAVLWGLFRWVSRPTQRLPWQRKPSRHEDLAELRAEVDRLKEEIQAIRVPKPSVSPYNQALGMAQEGVPAGEVAIRCGITRGEAELLVALFGKAKIKGLE